MCFFEVDRSPIYWFSAWIAGSGQVISLGEKESEHAKAKPWRKLTPGALLTSDIPFLTQSSLGKPLVYCIRNFCNLDFAVWVYFIKR